MLHRVIRVPAVLLLACVAAAGCLPAQPAPATVVSASATLRPPPEQPRVATVTAAATFQGTPAPENAWIYSALGDSSSWGFPKFYARWIETDLGVKVDVRMWTRGGATSADVLDLLRTNARERQDVSNSQVVTFSGNPLHLIGMRITSGYAQDRYDCSPQTVAAYKAELGSIADEVLALRKGKSTTVRTYTRFMPFYRVWRATGNFDEFRRCVAALDAAIFEMAGERGIQVADIGVAMNGTNHDQDPAEQGYLYDGIDENDSGAQIVAGVFRKLGYTPIVP